MSDSQASAEIARLRTALEAIRDSLEAGSHPDAIAALAAIREILEASDTEDRQ